MASRFQRDNNAANRSSLFSGYDQQQTRSRPTSASPAPSRFSHSPSGPSYGYNAESSSGGSGGAFGAYPSSSSGNGGFANSGGYGGGVGVGGDKDGFRSATPNGRGQYSDAVLNELESQNDEQVSVLSGKVAMLKDITMKIGDEIRDSTALAEKMNDQFGNTSAKLKGTMNRMLRMAERTGVGWKVWLGFFAFVIVLFWYVWLF